MRIHVKRVISLLVFMTLCRYVLADDVQITTYYPAPYGSYQDLVTDGDTTFAKNTGAAPKKNVGIGTGNETPRGKLDVSWGSAGATGAMGTNRWMQLGNPSGAGNDEARLWLQLYDDGGTAEAPVMVLSDENQAPKIQMQQWGTVDESNPDNYVTIGHAGALTNDMRITSAAGAVNVGVGTASINAKAPQGNIDVNDVYLADTATWASTLGGGSSQAATGSYVGDAMCMPGNSKTIVVGFTPDYVQIIMVSGVTGRFTLTDPTMGGQSFVTPAGMQITGINIIANGFRADSTACILPEADAPGVTYYWHAYKE